jgi:hypothetical protein
METLEDVVLKVVRAREGLSQKEVIKQVWHLKKSDRTVREHLKRMEDVSVRAVREGREMHYYSMKEGRQSIDIRVLHTEKLKTILEAFRDQIPVPDESGTHMAEGRQYTSALQLESERHVLFEDLLDHLGQMPLVPDPAAAWLDFKRASEPLAAARDVLWEMCEAATEDAFKLKVSSRWSGSVVSTHCVEFVYMYATARAGGVQSPQKGLPQGRVERTDRLAEYWLGGIGIVRRPLRAQEDINVLQRDLEERLRRLLHWTRRESVQKVARKVVEAKGHLSDVRESLVKALDEAGYFEVFPGQCRYLGSAP